MRKLSGILDDTRTKRKRKKHERCQSTSADQGNLITRTERPDLRREPSR